MSSARSSSSSRYVWDTWAADEGSETEGFSAHPSYGMIPGVYIHSYITYNITYTHTHAYIHSKTKINQTQRALGCHP